MGDPFGDPKSWAPGADIPVGYQAVCIHQYQLLAADFDHLVNQETTGMAELLLRLDVSATATQQGSRVEAASETRVPLATVASLAIDWKTAGCIVPIAQGTLA